MANRKPKNVKRLIGIISKDVTEDAYHGGGAGGIDIAPYVCAKSGIKIKVNFGQGSYNIGSASNISSEAYTFGKDGSIPAIYMIVEINEARTQLVASLNFYESDYQAITNQIVIYDGTAISEEVSSTSDIEYAWPTVEFTVDSNVEGMSIFGVLDGFSITN